MKALTLFQPYADGIAWAGKLIENRSWQPPRAILGERIAIHAGASKRNEAWGVPPMAEKDLREPLPRSAIVCTAVVLGALDMTNPVRPQTPMCLRNGMNQLAFRERMIKTMPADPWWVGPVGWLLAEVRSLAVPVPCKGAMGLWTVPEDVEQLVLERTRYVALDGEPGYWRVCTPRDTRMVSKDFGDQDEAIEVARQQVQQDLWMDRGLARDEAKPLLRLVR